MTLNLHDIFNKCTGPVKRDYELLKREDRVLALGDWAIAVVVKSERDPEVEYWLAQCLLAWLRSDGGKLTRDHLKTAAEAGSTQSEPRLWQRLKEPSSRGQKIPDASPTMKSLSNQEIEPK